MADTNINVQDVINDLAEQVKRLTVDNAVLRSALAAAQQASAAAPIAAPAATDEED